MDDVPRLELHRNRLPDGHAKFVCGDEALVRLRLVTDLPPPLVPDDANDRRIGGFGEHVALAEIAQDGEAEYDERRRNGKGEDDLAYAAFGLRVAGKRVWARR